MKNDNQNNAFIEKCRSMDFSSESANRDKNLEILIMKLKNIENEKEIIMNKKIKKSTAFVVAAAVLICLSMAVYGQELFRVIKTVTLGNHASYSVIEDNRDVIPLPEELQGLLFDKNGNELKTVPEDRVYYDKNGEKAITIVDNEMFLVVTEKEFNEIRSTDNYINYKDFEEGKKYFICDVFFPSYLPEGFTFDRIEFYKDPANQNELEPGSQKYMNMYFSDGTNEIYSQIRFMDEETAFESSGTGNIQKTKINGYDAVIDGNALDIQIGDVMYMLFAPDSGVSDGELVKIAESLE